MQSRGLDPVTGHRSKCAKGIDGDEETLGIERRKMFSVLMLGLVGMVNAGFAAYSLLVQRQVLAGLAVYLPCTGMCAVGLFGWIQQRSDLLFLFAQCMVYMASVMTIWGGLLCTGMGSPSAACLSLLSVPVSIILALFAVTGWKAYSTKEELAASMA